MEREALYDLDFLGHRVLIGDECWEWTGGKSGGYGVVARGGDKGHGSGHYRHAHIVFYELVKGPIPNGLLLHHTCENRACVNPSHLLPTTHREHPGSAPDVMRRKTHCKKGHPYDEANTYVWRGHRQCRACKLEHQRAKSHR